MVLLPHPRIIVQSHSSSKGGRVASVATRETPFPPTRRIDPRPGALGRFGPPCVPLTPTCPPFELYTQSLLRKVCLRAPSPAMLLTVRNRRCFLCVCHWDPLFREEGFFRRGINRPGSRDPLSTKLRSRRWIINLPKASYYYMLRVRLNIYICRFGSTLECSKQFTRKLIKLIKKFSFN